MLTETFRRQAEVFVYEYLRGSCFQLRGGAHAWTTEFNWGPDENEFYKLVPDTSRKLPRIVVEIEKLQEAGPHHVIAEVFISDDAPNIRTGSLDSRFTRMDGPIVSMLLWKEVERVTLYLYDLGRVRFLLKLPVDRVTSVWLG